MRTIPAAFRKNGYRFELLERGERSAIYAQYHSTGKLCAYETVRVRTREASQTPQFAIEAGEYLPTTAEWGRHGWTSSTLESARAVVARKGL